MKKNISASVRKVRFLTATALFDGHDAAINIIRRILQQEGAEVVHLGHNRSVKEIAIAAIQEGVQAIAVSSYQGGHIEFYKYLKDLLKRYGVEHIKIFGGGGGVIVPEEIKELEEYGIEKIYSPEEGQRLGLVGMIRDMIARASEVIPPSLPDDWKERLMRKDNFVISQLIAIAERDYADKREVYKTIGREIRAMAQKTPVVGVTGTGGSGKSSLEDEFIRRFLLRYPEKTLAILAIDPTRKKTGGALLGDRIRMNFLDPQRTYMRSLATRESKNELTISIRDSIAILRAAGYDLILIETPGIGQGDASIVEYSDCSVYVMTSEYGAPSQLEKIDMLDFADLIVLNKFDHKNSMDALRDIRKQYRRNHGCFDVDDDELPIVPTVASNFSDPGLDVFFDRLITIVKRKGFSTFEGVTQVDVKALSHIPKTIIPTHREQYLWEIAETIATYNDKTEKEANLLKKFDALKEAYRITGNEALKEYIEKIEPEIDNETKDILEKWNLIKSQYEKSEFCFRVRDKEIITQMREQTLAGLKIPKIALPSYDDRAQLYRWLRKEHLPGYFPYTAGVFPFRREGEDPKRQFAGEGTPTRTNKRFHYLTRGDVAKRLSTAFDSITLYGEDPSEEPDIFGKIGESGVSVCTLDDMKKLYAGFDLCDPLTSVSMTINGPAPMMLAFFFNTAIDQQIDKFISQFGREPQEDEREKIKKDVLRHIRGTVQADILKEDQGQNTCIFSIPFALKMMGDIQEYFIQHNVRNFYSVSISGYHIAEAGANPITQLALTLSNAFTYVEYYLSRGMRIDDFAPNLSFFFSSGMDAEYNVLIRVARRIWAIAMKYRYGANEQSQRLKCHIQTSGRSLHAQEMQFNDIRTTLQALMALNDNCNSLHTNSYDEAVTTPTEESVRRAMAIQLIINKEYGIFKNQNPLQGSFIIEWLTDEVEKAVLEKFRELNLRGGVLGAMEMHYQRSMIQDESLLYEHKKHSGELPIIGVNTYLNPAAQETQCSRSPLMLSRATYDEKMEQIHNLREFKRKNEQKAKEMLSKLRDVAMSGKNIFAQLMETARYASLGQMTAVLYEAGGKYRRNM
ncbi:MAG: methylmalonyl-CoA mutase family protein [Spirochaetes bacterium]|nr:methylmalonyl-CoA mutase family protein [Spirochaetota bacterium]